jgi:hypothetical protein
MPRQHHERLQGIQTFLGDFHGLEFTIMSIYLIDIEELARYLPPGAETQMLLEKGISLPKVRALRL